MDLANLCDLGFLRREVPFGLTLRDTKRTRYSLGDPLLRFWYRFVDPNRSLLEAGVLQVASSTSATSKAGDKASTAAGGSSSRGRVAGSRSAPSRSCCRATATSSSCSRAAGRGGFR